MFQLLHSDFYPVSAPAPLRPLRPLPRSFFARNPRRVARDLLGKILVREGKPRLAARIVEVEAYLGQNDPAAHAAAGNTARTSVLFGPPGYAYVYFIYGNHYCLNEMARARAIVLRDPRDLPKLTSGPGRLAQAFGITRSRDNGCDLTSPTSALWIGEDGFRANQIQITPRIGITKAADQPFRYALAGNACLSGRKISAGDLRPRRRLDKRV